MAKMAKNGFSLQEAHKVLELLNLDIDKQKFSIEEFKDGLNEELEHKDVTHSEAIKTGKIALAHLHEDPKYYTKLSSVMKARLIDLKKDDRIGDMIYLDLDNANKSFSKSTMAAKNDECNSLDEEDMDLKKKFKSKAQRKFMHAAAARGDVSQKVVDEFEAKTPKGAKLPEKLKKKDKDVKKSLSNAEDMLKALKAATISSLGRRDRLNAAYQTGMVAGRATSPFYAEPVSIDHADLNIGIDKAHQRPSYEPPAVPVRRVSTPQDIPLQKCGDHTYDNKRQIGPSEALPYYKRRG